MYKKFGYMMGGVLACLGLWQLIGRARPIGIVFVALGGLFLIAASLRPSYLKPVYEAWMRLGHALSWVNTRIILFLLYIAFFLPIGLVMRMFGKDFLNEHIRPGQASYWTEKFAIEDASRYEKQY
jgi:hypothetical protein